MGLVIRCWWLPPDTLSVDGRMREAIASIQIPEVSSLLGAEWFKGSNSKKAALTKPVHLSDVEPKKPPWRWASMTDYPPHNEVYYQIGLWNGSKPPASASLSITIHEPAISPGRRGIAGLETDKLIITGPELSYLRSNGATWSGLLSLTQKVALSLGGRSEITSDELWDWGQRSKAITQVSDAAYAAFWGTDRSGQNPLYHSVDQINGGQPLSIVACDSWEQAERPDVQRMQGLIGRFLRPLNAK